LVADLDDIAPEIAEDLRKLDSVPADEEPYRLVVIGATALHFWIPEPRCRVTQDVDVVVLLRDRASATLNDLRGEVRKLSPSRTIEIVPAVSADAYAPEMLRARFPECARLAAEACTPITSGGRDTRRLHLATPGRWMVLKAIAFDDCRGDVGAKRPPQRDLDDLTSLIMYRTPEIETLAEDVLSATDRELKTAAISVLVEQFGAAGDRPGLDPYLDRLGTTRTGAQRVALRDLAALAWDRFLARVGE
jgi:hypothetical protein